MSLLNNEQTRLWLGQFPKDDVSTASKLLERFVYVDDAGFARRISYLAMQTYADMGPVAFFIERELPMRWANVVRPITRKTRAKLSAASPLFRVAPSKILRPVRMYKEDLVDRGRSVPKRLRAEGAALPVVASPRNDRQVIGSEGIVASAISKLCEQHPEQFFLQPNAKKVRVHRIRQFVVVTDFIGTGG